MKQRVVRINDPDRAEILAEVRGESAPARAPHDYKADLVEQLEAVGIPSEPEFYFALPKRKFRADWLIRPNILVEYEGGLFMKDRQGASHSSVGGILRDIEKHNLAAELGYLVIRVTAKHVQNGQALKWIETAHNKVKSKLTDTAD